MNPIYLGFFDELEKIATHKDDVTGWKRHYQKYYKGASRAMIGEAANRDVQMGRDTMGKRIDPGKPGHEPGVFNITIPKPGKPEERIVGTREQADKRRARNRRMTSRSFNGDMFPINDYLPGVWAVRRQVMREIMREDEESRKPKPRVIADPYADAVRSTGGVFKNSPVKFKRYGK